jgi:hypothetical protein
MKVEAIRRRYFKRCNFDNLNANKARQYKHSLRIGRTKLRDLPDGTPLKDEGLLLFDAHINAMDAIIKSENEVQALEFGRGIPVICNSCRGCGTSWLTIRK